ncbi:Gamma-tubulin complex component 3 [Geodia barretti]|uniref:Gamma-tubulin complex component 3 n=1 Tax=Geodia barretti TaxID=519541 RepID=A0AA35RRP7_GEOBA|nr:Gamma-tubulin complex component 3 [Geodia barretti]
MVPSFISEDLAKKILIIGKSINFLRQVCHDHTPLWSPSLRLWFTTESGEVTFSSMTGSSLQSVVAQTYTETSRHLLQIMNTKYSFGKHLQAIRKYLLLGQGDLIRHLMDLLAQSSSKPAVSLYLHNLTGTLETAIRATNAQFEDPDILKRLDVQKLEPSLQDQGWDVFSLQYHVDGPISTVFTAENMLTYLKVFNFLWRAKRVQYYLSHVWNEQTAHYRSLQSIPDAYCNSVYWQVMECNWDSLLKKVREAEDLDQIISAHDTFLQQITSQSLLNTDGQPLLSLLRMLFDLIISFREKQTSMLATALGEVERRRDWDLQSLSRERQGVWGVREKEEEGEMEMRASFAEETVPKLHSEFAVLYDLFKDKVVDFMHKLTAHSEQKLRFLCFRLDFNEFYSSSSSELRSTSFIRKMK